MKKILLTITIAFVTLLTMAQSPNLMNYQGVARNAVGNVLPNQSISLRLSILNGSGGPVVYSETRTMLTNAFGLFNVVVGSSGATSTTGTIAGINWTAFGAGSGPKYLQVEIDPNGGSSFTNVGATQLVSVPYALNASGAAPVGPAGGDLTGTYPNPLIFFPLIKTFNFPASQLIGMTNSSPTGTLGAITGSSASQDAIATAILGTISSASPGSSSAALRGNNNGTGNLGIGVTGTHAGSGWGVYGLSQSGLGVFGQTTGGTGAGIYGQSTTGIGVYGISNTNNSAFFENTNAANTANTVNIQTNGVGNGLSSINTGTGRGAFFQVNNAASTANALEVTTNGTGPSWGIRANSTGTNGAGLFVQQNPANTSNNVFSNQTGLGRAGLFQNTNVGTQADAITAILVTTDPTPAAMHGINGSGGISIPTTKKGGWGESDNGVGLFGTSSSSIGVFGIANNSGVGVYGFALGNGPGILGGSTSGRAGDFNLLAGNNSTVVNATTAGNGNVINASTSGAGTAVRIANTNAANTAITTIITNAETANNAAPNGSLLGVRGAILPGTQFLVSDLAANPLPTAIGGISSTGIGVQGSSINGFGIAGISNTGYGTIGVSVLPTGTGVGAYAIGGGYALQTSGRLQFQGQGAAIDFIMGATDALGNATWRSPASLGLITGLGCAINFVPKFSPTTSNIVCSQIFDNGAQVGINTITPAFRLDVSNTGGDGIRSKSIASFSVIDVDASNGDAAFRMYSNGVGQWNIRNNPSVGFVNDLQIFELGGGGPRMNIQDGTGNVGIGPNGVAAYRLDVEHAGNTGIRSRSTASFSVVDIDASNGDAALRFQKAGIGQWNTRNNPVTNDYQIFELGGGGERVQIQDGTGNVGIGGISPAYRLDVNHGGGTGIRSQSSASFSVVDIDAANGDAALRFQKAGAGMWNTRNRPADDYYEWFELGGGGSRMVIQRATGNVGIGQTVSPAYRLDVQHGGGTGIRSQSTASFSVVDIDAANGDAALRFARAGVNQWNIRNRPADDYLEIFELGGGGSRMVIQDGTGNVGIGATVSPAYRLDVEHGGGTGIRSKSTASFSVVDIDAASGDAALRFQKAGVGMWNTRNEPINNDYQWFELGGGGERMRIQRGTGYVGVGIANPQNKMHIVQSGATSGITNLFAPGITLTANMTAATFGGTGLYIENTAANSGTRVAKVVNQIVAGGSGNGTFTLMSVSDNAGALINGSILTADLGSGNVGIGTLTPGTLLEVNGIASKPGGGSWAVSSDARLKQDVVPYTDGLKSVLAIQPVRYHYNALSGYDTKPEYVGVIAQQLNEVAPYMVGTAKKGNVDYLKVDNSAMIYMLINGMKEQQKMIDELKTEINNLKAQPVSGVKSITKTN